MTKRDIFYIAIIIIIIIFWKGCGSLAPAKTISFDLKHYSDSIIKVIIDKEKEQSFLQGVALMQDSVRVQWKDRWHKVKNIHDTIPCEEKLPIIIETCDSLIAADDSLINTQKKIINKANSIISDYKKVRTADSTNIENLTPRQYLLLGGDVTSGGNIFPSIGFDTKKGLFTAGYDPFNKQFKVGGYFKVKLWKRKK